MHCDVPKRNPYLKHFTWAKHSQICWKWGKHGSKSNIDIKIVEWNKINYTDLFFGATTWKLRKHIFFGLATAVVTGLRRIFFSSSRYWDLSESTWMERNPRESSNICDLVAEETLSYINPYVPRGLVHPYQLDKPISRFRGVWCTFSF